MGESEKLEISGANLEHLQCLEKSGDMLTYSFTSYLSTIPCHFFKRLM